MTWPLRSVSWVKRPALSYWWLVVGGFVQRVGDAGEPVAVVVLAALDSDVARVDEFGDLDHTVVFDSAVKTQL